MYKFNEKLNRIEDGFPRFKQEAWPPCMKQLGSSSNLNLISNAPAKTTAVPKNILLHDQRGKNENKEYRCHIYDHKDHRHTHCHKEWERHHGPRHHHDHHHHDKEHKHGKKKRKNHDD
jgi:hypothetical protein